MGESIQHLETERHFSENYNDKKFLYLIIFISDFIGSSYSSTKKDDHSSTKAIIVIAQKQSSF